jgi:hypothetical protein
MGFNSAFKGLKLLKNPGNGRLNNLNDPVLNVLNFAGRMDGSQVHTLRRMARTLISDSYISQHGGQV